MPLINQPPYTAVDTQDAETRAIGNVSPGWRSFFSSAYGILSAVTQSGPTAQRPTTYLWPGRMFFDVSVGRNLWWNGTAWVDSSGVVSYGVGDLLFANTTGTLSGLADVATGNALLSGGVGVAPAWGKVGLTTHIAGVLSVPNGGTGASTLSSSGLLYGAGTGAVQADATFAKYSGGRMLVGNPTDNTIDRLQVSGGLWVDKVTLRGAAIAQSAQAAPGISITAWSNGAGAGDGIGLQAGTGTTFGGGINVFASGASGAGSIAGDISIAAGPAGGANSNGGYCYYTTGTKTGAGTTGTHVWSDSGATSTMIFDPAAGVLSVPNIKTGTYTGGLVVQAGYVTITDSGGTPRRLLVG